MDKSNVVNGTVSKGIRFPVDLADQVERIARTQRRAFSQQVIHMVEECLKECAAYSEPEAHDLIGKRKSS
jgi:hypothetical protein